MFLHTLECPFTVVSASITIVPCLLFLATSTLCQTFRDIGPGLLLLDSQMKSSEHYIHKSNSNRFWVNLENVHTLTLCSRCHFLNRIWIAGIHWRDSKRGSLLYLLHLVFHTELRLTSGMRADEQWITKDYKNEDIWTTRQKVTFEICRDMNTYHWVL